MVILATLQHGSGQIFPPALEGLPMAGPSDIPTVGWIKSPMANKGNSSLKYDSTIGILSAKSSLVLNILKYYTSQFKILQVHLIQ